jgi:hypothetical protein
MNWTKPKHGSANNSCRWRAAEYSSKPTLEGTAWIYRDDVPLERLELQVHDYGSIYAFPSSSGRTLIGANGSIDRFRAARRYVEGNQEDANAFIGLITAAVSPGQFFSTENVDRILQCSAAQRNAAA